METWKIAKFFIIESTKNVKLYYCICHISWWYNTSYIQFISATLLVSLGRKILRKWTKLWKDLLTHWLDTQWPHTSWYLLHTHITHYSHTLHTTHTHYTLLTHYTHTHTHTLHTYTYLLPVMVHALGIVVVLDNWILLLAYFGLCACSITCMRLT